MIAACGAVEPPTEATDMSATVRAKAPDELWQALAARQSRSFIVAVAADPAGWADRKARLLDAVVPGEATVERDWDHLPLVQVRADTLDAAAAVLDGDAAVTTYPIERYALTDAESFPLIGQPAAAAAGRIGAGTSVAVLDTGADYTRPDLGSCTAPGVPASCRVAFAKDFAADDGARDDNGHGTNVSGIVAGVAPGARVLALDVFTGGGAWSTDIITAINWAIANKQTYNIASMNLSLGGGSSTAPCTTDAIGVALGAARTAGIAPVVASGNDGLRNAISSPACAPAAISVGAVYDANVGGLSYSSCSDPTTAADKITCFSNSASFLGLLAPGALISAAGYTMAGTSQATPHVAGALAVLHAAFPTDTVDQLVGRLTRTGKPILDPRNGVTTPRIDLFAALGATGADTAAPTGSVRINGGAAATTTAAVTLAITASDPSGVTQMCVSNTATCTAFEPFAATRAWTLAAGDGRKTVTVALRDGAGNTTTTTSPSAAITLDTTAPSNGAVTATPGNGRLALAWSGFADAGSGVASYRVAIASGAAPPASCPGDGLPTTTATSLVVTGLANSTAYGVRVCAVDGAGNRSTGATVSAAPRPESTPPVGTIAINGGAPATRSPTVTLALTATDDTRVAEMCLSLTTTCTTFAPYAAAASYALGAGDGPRTLRVWYRDPWGNTSAPVAATIVLDTTAPTMGALTATTSAARIALSWSPASDAGTGVATYTLVGAAGTVAPAERCTTGTVLATGTATSFVHAVTAKATWSYRLCATDRAGNVAAGATKTVTLL